MKLTCKQLACRQGDSLLFDDVSFDLESGQCLLIEGHNGCGKTTLLKTLAGLRMIDSGDIQWNGQPIHGNNPHYYQALLWMGHLPALKSDLSAFENLNVSTRLQQQTLTDEALLAALDNVGLYGREHLAVGVLSQGQKKKALLANILLSKATLWIMDEPFVGLDKEAVTWLLTVMIQHLEQGGMLILTTHQVVNLPQQSTHKLKLDAWAIPS